MNDLHSKALSLITNYPNNILKNGKYVTFNLYENTERIKAYLNNTHISGSEDALGREKPFDNIVRQAVNAWYKATDIDRKDIKITSSKRSQTLAALMLDILLKKWMKEENFGIFLNKWGRRSAEYCSTVLKFVEKEDKLHCEVIPWSRIIVDPLDFYSNWQIEKIYTTPSKLKAMGYKQDVVEELIDDLTKRKNFDNTTITNDTDFIEIFEIHGEMPKSFITGKEKDKNTYTQQMHVISFSEDGKGEEKGYTLFSGEEKQTPYMITHLIEEDDRTQGVGPVEMSFDNQWMANHYAKLIKDQLDTSSQSIYQTSDASFAGSNVLNNFQTGDIFVHQPNQPLTKVNNSSTDVVTSANMANTWKATAKEITGTPDAITGNTMPSGTAYRQVAVLNREAHSLFEIMVENKSLYLEKMLRERIIPFLKKRIDNAEEISSLLSSSEITQIDSKFIEFKSQKMVEDFRKQLILSGQMAEEIPMGAIQQNIKNSLTENGQTRYFKPSELEDITWKELLKDIEYDVDINISGESANKEVVLSTLTTLLNTIKDPAILQDKRAELIFDKIAEETGVISPVELASINKNQQSSPMSTTAQTPPSMPVGGA